MRTDRFVCPEYIGRERELARLSEALRASANGNGGAALIAGEAGIGKTRLVQELRHAGESSGFLALVGACALEEQGVAHQVIVDALRSRLRGLSREELHAELGDQAPELSRLLPELVETTAAPPEQGGLTSPEERSRLFEAVLQYLLRLSAGQPLLLVLEDIHWANHSAIELIRYVCRYVSESRTLLVLTYRSDEPASEESVERLVAALTRMRVVREGINLAPLSWFETKSYVTSALGLERPARTGLVDEVYSRAEGNPFFTEELLNGLGPLGESASPSEIAQALDSLPESLDAVLRERLRSLSQEARRAVGAAAVIGRQFSARLLASVIDMTEKQTDAAMREAVGQLVITGGHVQDDSFQFRHALLQHAARNLLLPFERRRLHSRIAETLGKLKTPKPAAELAALAYHYQMAGVQERVKSVAEAAGEAACRAGAPGEGARWYEAAVAAYRSLDQEEPLNLLERAAGANAEAGHYVHGAEIVGQIVDRLRTQGEIEAAGDALVKQARLFYWGGDQAGARAKHEEAEHLLEPLGECPSLARNYAGLAGLELTNFHGREAYLLADKALQIAGRVGARDAEARAKKTIGSVLAASIDPKRGEVLLRGALEYLLEEDPVEGGTCFINLSFALMKAGNWTEAKEVALRGFTYSKERGLSSRQSAIASNLNLVCRLTGSWDEASEWAKEAERALGDDWGRDRIFARLGSGCLLANKGRWEELKTGIEEILPTAEQAGTFQTLGIAYWLLAQAALGMNEMAKSVEFTELALVLWRTTLDSFWGLPLLVDSCRLFAKIGRLDHARACLEDLNRVKERAHTGMILGSIANAEALIASAESRIEDAVDWWRKTIEAWANVGWPYDEARARLALAELLLRRNAPGDRDDARRELLPARYAFARLGAPEVAAIDDLLRRSRLVAPPSRRAASELSEREREVVARIVQGKTNRKIAEELFITEKTVGHHVSRILAKLALSSRTQLSAYAIEHRLLDRD